MLCALVFSLVLGFSQRCYICSGGQRVDKLLMIDHQVVLVFRPIICEAAFENSIAYIGLQNFCG
jgi:hypothetical protein